MKKLLLLGIIAVAVLLTSCATDMYDCCECLYEGSELSCSEPQDQCIGKCFDECENVDACRCSAATRSGCEAECGCELPW